MVIYTYCICVLYISASLNGGTMPSLAGAEMFFNQECFIDIENTTRNFCGIKDLFYIHVHVYVGNRCSFDWKD